MIGIIRLYLRSVLRPVFEDPHEDVTQLLNSKDGDQLQDLDQTTSYGDDELVDGRSQALSLNGSEWNDGQSIKRRQASASSAKTSLSRPSTWREPGGKHGFDYSNLLDSDGPKLIPGIRSWLIIYQVNGQINWLGLPFYVSLVYKLGLYALIFYISVQHFLIPQIESNVVDSNYRNPIFILIGALAFVTCVLHTLLTIYSNLFNLCPLFKTLTTPRLCFIREEVQHVIGTKTLFFMLVFHIYQCILLQMLGMRSISQWFNQFQVGRFALDCFVTMCMDYFFVGLMHIDFYVRLCFGFWIIGMKTNLQYRSAFLHRYERMIRLAGRQDGKNTSNADQQQQQATSTTTTLNDLDQPANLSAATNDDIKSQQSVETNTTINTTIINYNNKQRPLAGGRSVEQVTLNSLTDRYKLDTMDEIQKNLNTMDDHLEVCRNVQNGSLVLITLNAFLTAGTLLLLAYNLLANQGDFFHGIIMILLAFNLSGMVFVSYIGDSWLAYALSSFVQTVEDEYFLQGGDDCTSVAMPPPKPKSASSSARSTVDGDMELPLHWSVIRKHGKATTTTATSTTTTSETIVTKPSSSSSSAAAAAAAEPSPSSRQGHLYLIKKKDVLFCREFLNQFKNHLATPWSKLTVKVHLHMIGTFVTLIAAQIIFDREH